MIPGTNPRLHKTMVNMELKELEGQLQKPRQGPMELTVIVMCMANIILIALRLSVKLGAQCQLGVMMLHLTKPVQELGEDPPVYEQSRSYLAFFLAPPASIWGHSFPDPSFY